MMLRPPDEIDWYEGMVLEPQHFIDDRVRRDRLLHCHLASIAPFYWGLKRLKLDMPALSAGTIRVLELEGVMPDGLYISKDESSEELMLDLLDPAIAAHASTGRVQVHLAVPAQSASVLDSERVLQRYLPVPPRNPSDDGEIPRLRPNLKLLTGDNVPPNYTSFPLLKLKTEDKNFIVTEYVPPILRLPLQGSVPRLDQPVWTLCEDVERLIREKLLLLADKLNLPDNAGNAASLSKWAIRGLAAGLPGYQAQLSSKLAHPYSVYLALCNIMGFVAPLGPNLLPPRLDPYDHNRLKESFDVLVEFILTSVRNAVPENYQTIRFSQEESAFRLFFSPEWLKLDLVLGIRRSPTQTIKEINDWFSDCIVCSDSKWEIAQKKRIVGLERTPFKGHDELFPTGEMALYQLTPDPEFLAGNEKLVAKNPSTKDESKNPAEMLLFLLKR